jgi:hypothetical protein
MYIHDMVESPVVQTPPYYEEINTKMSFLKLKKKKHLSQESLPPSPASSTHSSVSYFESTPYILSNVFTQDQLVINFRNIKPRSTPLQLRPINHKLETKSLFEWQNQLLTSLENNAFPATRDTVKNLAIRDFIINEFFSTEVTYWNQLNYTRVVS